MTPTRMWVSADLVSRLKLTHRVLVIARDAKGNHDGEECTEIDEDEDAREPCNQLCAD